MRRHKELHRGPTWHQITAAGLRAAGSDLPAPRGFDLATHRHDAGLGWLMLAAQRGAVRAGAARDLRATNALAATAGPSDRAQRFGVRLGGVGPGGRDRLHYPDLVLVTRSGHRVAFELELSTKEVARRERILAGYAADRRIDAVVYLVRARGGGPGDRALGRADGDSATWSACSA